MGRLGTERAAYVGFGVFSGCGGAVVDATVPVRLPASVRPSQIHRRSAAGLIFLLEGCSHVANGSPCTSGNFGIGW
jgi:hypothetical protein